MLLDSDLFSALDIKAGYFNIIMTEGSWIYLGVIT